MMSEERFCKTSAKSIKEAEKAIEKAVEHSFLIKLNSDGTELRGHNGKVYVCAVGNDNTITVITILKGNKFVS